MKTYILILSVFFMGMLTMNAQKTKEIQIKTSAQCEMCKDRIEKALSYENGVVSSNLDLKTKIVTVVYNPKKISPDRLRLAISKVGYQADDLKADPFAYEALPACCKLPDNKNYQQHRR